MIEFTITPQCVGRWYPATNADFGIKYEWSAVDPADAGVVVFSSPRAKTTYVRFLAPGSYCIKSTAFTQP